MKQARFFSLIVIGLLSLYGLVGFYFLPQASFNGDLTRMGMMPEHLFGWRKPQPAINAALLTQAKWQDADVLVVGDSFSDGRLWQTALTRRGLKVRTEWWDNIRAVCGDFEPWLRRQGFRGKVVIFEIVERSARNIHESLGCEHMSTHYNSQVDAPRGAPLTVYDPDRRSYDGRLSIGIRTVLNGWKYQRLSRQPDFSRMPLANGVTLARVPEGCQLFSHLACRDVLFLTARQSADLPESLVGDIQKLNSKFTGMVPLWAVVPNKSTVYLYPDKQFWNKAELNSRSINLLRAFRHAVDRKTVDLYFANNTHLSPTGYLLMGETIYNSLPAFLRNPGHPPGAP